MFYFVGIVLTFFLAGLLFTKEGKSEADLILTIWLIAIGVNLIFVFLQFTDRIFSFPYLLGLNFPLPLLHGPFLFLYTGAITNQRVTYKYRFLHFLPFLFIYLIFLPYYFLPMEQRIDVYKNEGQGYETQLLVMIVSIMISGVVYVASSLLLLRKHKSIIREQFSSTDKINLMWLRYLIYGIGVIWLLVFFGDDDVIFNAVVLFVIFLGYFGIRQVGIFSQQYPSKIISSKDPEIGFVESLALSNSNFIEEVESVTGSAKKEKYLKTGLSEEAAIEIHKGMTEVINKERLFINTELTLAQLAQTLEVHPNKLSQVINTFEEKSFYDYINDLRIEEFKRIVSLPQNQKYTLLALAHDCGFNSKTSFNRNFKKSTGLSPTEYLKQVQISLQQ